MTRKIYEDPLFITLYGAFASPLLWLEITDSTEGALDRDELWVLGGVVVVQASAFAHFVTYPDAIAALGRILVFPLWLLARATASAHVHWEPWWLTAAGALVAGPLLIAVGFAWRWLVDDD